MDKQPAKEPRTGSGHGLKLSAHGKRQIQELLDRAAGDIQFRELLLRDPEKVLTDPQYTGGKEPLSDTDKTLLFSMRRVALEEAGIDVRKSRSFLRDNGARAPL